MAGQQLSAQVNVTVYETQDIGGTDFWTVGLGANAGWVPMINYEQFCAFVTIGATWNAADQLDGLFLQEATDAVGTAAQAIPGGNLNQAAVNAAGESFCLEARAEDMSEGFTHIRCMISEAGNTGVDNVSCTYVRSACRYANANESGCTATVKA